MDLYGILQERVLRYVDESDTPIKGEDAIQLLNAIYPTIERVVHGAEATSDAY